MLDSTVSFTQLGRLFVTRTRTDAGTYTSRRYVAAHANASTANARAFVRHLVDAHSLTTRVRVGPRRSLAIDDARLSYGVDALLAAGARVFPRERVDGDVDDVFALGARETRRRGVGMSTDRRNDAASIEATVSSTTSHITGVARALNDARRRTETTVSCARSVASSRGASRSFASRAVRVAQERNQTINQGARARLANAAVGDVDASDACVRVT